MRDVEMMLMVSQTFRVFGDLPNTDRDTMYYEFF